MRPYVSLLFVIVHEIPRSLLGPYKALEAPCFEGSPRMKSRANHTKHGGERPQAAPHHPYYFYIGFVPGFHSWAPSMQGASQAL